MNLLQLMQLADKYAQTVSQKEIGDAEAITLKKTQAWEKVKVFLQNQTTAKNVKLSQIDVSVAFGFKLTIGPKKNAIAIVLDKIDVYYASDDNNDNERMNDLNNQIRSQFEGFLVRDVLRMYQTDSGCKNVLNIDAQPNSTYYARIKIKLN